MVELERQVGDGTPEMGQELELRAEDKVGERDTPPARS
jgi:hypothetical protein